jgi:hypothetical protein
MIDWKTIWAYIANREPEPKEPVYCNECKHCVPDPMYAPDTTVFKVAYCKATLWPASGHYVCRPDPEFLTAPCSLVNKYGDCKKYEPL